jgi:branched-chain amino acid transport system ATP-binding protein
VSGYGRKRILFGIDIEVSRGEVVCVIGPNGAGKTTLLLSLMGGATHHEGRITFDGRDTAGLMPEQMVRAGLALCPEGRRIFQHLTVEENLLAALLPGRSRPRKEALSEAYELFPVLHQKRNEPAGRMSGGQQQMLAVARALVPRPDVLMLDEPSLGLAPKVVASIFERLLQLQSGGLTLVLVDQNVELALDVSDYAYVMQSGRMAMEGPAARLHKDPGLIEAFLRGAAAVDELASAPQ